MVTPSNFETLNCPTPPPLSPINPNISLITALIFIRFYSPWNDFLGEINKNPERWEAFKGDERITLPLTLVRLAFSNPTYALSIRYELTFDEENNARIKIRNVYILTWIVLKNFTYINSCIVHAWINPALIGPVCPIIELV